MKKAGIIFGFIPLFIYGVISGILIAGTIYALAAATVACFIVGFNELKSRIILTWTNLVLFSALLVAIGPFGQTWIIPYEGIIIYGTLAAISFVSIFAGKPFTLQYARSMVDQKLWDNSFFIKSNYLITGVWGCVFLINTGLSAVGLVFQGVLFTITHAATYLALAGGILFTVKYPEYIHKKYSK